MSKLLKRLNDNQNKVADTNGIMKLQVWDYGVAQDLTGKKITATVANASGFLFDIDLVSNGTEIDLDFKNERLQKLTPDTYFLEIKVTDEAGDVSVFPTEGYAIFTINKNLHATEGALVPQITFDTVLADVKTAMDKTVANYVKTIAKGDKGDTGPAGKDAEMPIIGGRNYILNSQRTLSASSGVQDTGWVDTAIPISMFSNNIFTISVQVDYDNVTDVKGFGRAGIQITANEVSQDGSTKICYVEAWSKAKVGDSFHGRVSATLDMRGKTLQSIYLPTHWGQGMYISGITATNVSVSNPQLEIGNIATDWSPAPNDAPSNDAQLVHKTNNEVLAGDKTFTGNTTLATTTILADNYGLRVTPSGFQKTTDGRTWVSANI